jgi:hypothetical protein
MSKMQVQVHLFVFVFVCVCVYRTLKHTSQVYIPYTYGDFLFGILWFHLGHTID